MTRKSSSKIGFIGQGFIGKNYADDFEERGYDIVRYGLEIQYKKYKTDIQKCDIVFIAVPTPTTTTGFDDSAIRQVLSLVGDGKIAVIKSTVLPGRTEIIQSAFPNIHVFHSPEFLIERTAAYDARHPKRNIIGIPVSTPETIVAAKHVLSVLPPSQFSRIMSSREAELIKYAGNCLLFTKVVFVNMLYDVADNLGCDWEEVKQAMIADGRLGDTHFDPVHASGHSDQSGRGAGGHCFIKDFAAFREMYTELVGDQLGTSALQALEKKNCDLLKKSKKDLDLLAGVYGSGG